MKMRVGQVPTLQWWQIKNMTDAEIQEYNNKHLQVVEMKQSLESQMIDGVFPSSMKEGLFKVKSMPRKTLCLYEAQNDKVINVTNNGNTVEFQIKVGMNSFHLDISQEQMKMLKEWMKENEI